MSTNKNLFQEAIADAKAVREAALLNAKAALEEVITPRLQSILDAKLNEISDDSDLEMEEGFDTDEFGFDGEDGNDLEEELNLEAILAELEEENDTLQEAKDDDKEDEKDEEGDEKKKDVSVEDLSFEDLEDMIVNIVRDELAGEKETDSEEMMGGEEVEAGEEEVDINELLAELEELNENEMYEKEMNDEKQELNEVDFTGIADLIQKIMSVATGPEVKEILQVIGGMASIGLSGIAIPKINAYLEKNHPKVYDAIQGAARGAAKAKGINPDLEESTELNEAISTIKFLRTELNEVNLLNAKLLYVNKIFKAKNLTESQKLNVIATFDKATNVKEAKLVFESLIKSISSSTTKKNSIKESMGFASKAAGMAPKQQIIESNDVISRMQRLANIK
jgi:hypothetical protein